MKLIHLSLQNFRSFKKNSFFFSPKTTVIVGKNAVGKTNILESIFLLSLGKSFRADKTAEMISFSNELSRVSGTIKTYYASDVSLGGSTRANMHDEIKLEIVLTKGEVMGQKTPIKKYSKSGVAKRMIDFVGNLKVVLFWPEDLELVTDSPSIRRKYLDHVLLQVDREYRRCLLSYEKGLRQRNKLLEVIRDGNSGRNQLLFWDQMLIKNGQYISRKREEYIDYVNSDQRSAVSGQLDKYKLIYDKSTISRTRLEQYQDREISAGVTLVGPHRDDIKFKILNLKLKIDRNLSSYGSRGEQRFAILWLKLSELSFITEETGVKPVLLLDDIFSELDKEHQEIIFEIINNQQTILTTTDENNIPKDRLEEGKIIKL